MANPQPAVTVNDGNLKMSMTQPIENYEIDATQLRGINPWLRDYIAERCGFQLPTMRDKVRTLLISCSVNELRSIGRSTKTKHTGVQNALVCYLFINSSKVISRGEVYWDDLFWGRLSRFWSSPSNISNPTSESTFRKPHNRAPSRRNWTKLVYFRNDTS